MSTHRHTCDICGVNLQCNDSQCKYPTVESTSNCGTHDQTAVNAYYALRQSLPNTRKPILTPVVKRALVYTITNIGQLSRTDKLELERAVRRGCLSKGKGGAYPILKTVYAHPGFDFAKDREADVADIRRAHMIDMARGTDKFFPWVAFEEVTA